jgi:hypothetical protein
MKRSAFPEVVRDRIGKNDAKRKGMTPPIGFREACELQTTLAANHLTGACVSAGRLVIVEVNVPAQTQVKELLGLLKTQNEPLPESIGQSIASCVRRYPDGSLKIDLHFGSREEASSFLDIARSGMCISRRDN